VAYAREVGEYQSSPAVPTEAEGTRLHLSRSNRTGYRGVRKMDSGRFKAEHERNGRKVNLGIFDTTVEAAVAYAREIRRIAALRFHRAPRVRCDGCVTESV